MEAISQIFNGAFWYMAPVLVALTTTLSGFINNTFNVKTHGLKQIVSWAVATALSCGAIAFGFLGAGIAWQSYVALSIVVGLSSNGFYEITFIKSWVNALFGGLH